MQNIKSDVCSFDRRRKVLIFFAIDVNKVCLWGVWACTYWNTSFQFILKGVKQKFNEFSIIYKENISYTSYYDCICFSVTWISHVELFLLLFHETSDDDDDGDEEKTFIHVLQTLLVHASFSIAWERACASSESSFE